MSASPHLITLGVALNAAMRESPTKIMNDDAGQAWVERTLERAAADLFAASRERVSEIVEILAGARAIRVHVQADESVVRAEVLP